MNLAENYYKSTYKGSVIETFAARGLKGSLYRLGQVTAGTVFTLEAVNDPSPISITTAALLDATVISSFIGRMGNPGQAEPQVNSLEL